MAYSPAVPRGDKNVGSVTLKAVKMGLGQKESDLQMMLAAECHLGTKNVDYQMERYVYKRRKDGIYVINLAKTYEKLQLAARIIVAIENPQDIVAQSARPYGQRAVLKFAHYTGCKAIAGRHTPGTFTNQIQKMYEEPRLLILTDPYTDNQPIKEASYVNIPTIAFCDTDAPLSHVDVAIPANNKAPHSIGCLYYLLSRMVCQMRDSIPQDQPWDVMVDLFFYREPEEAKEEVVEEDGAMVEAGFSASPALPGTEGFTPEAVAGTYADPAVGFPGAAAPASGAQWPDDGAGMGFAAAAPPAEGLQYSATESFGASY